MSSLLELDRQYSLIYWWCPHCGRERSSNFAKLVRIILLKMS